MLHRAKNAPACGGRASRGIAKGSRGHLLTLRSGHDVHASCFENRFCRHGCPGHQSWAGHDRFFVLRHSPSTARSTPTADGVGTGETRIYLHVSPQAEKFIGDDETEAMHAGAEPAPMAGSREPSNSVPLDSDDLGGKGHGSVQPDNRDGHVDGCYRFLLCWALPPQALPPSASLSPVCRHTSRPLFVPTYIAPPARAG